ncbi:hypothetical protein [Streptomyces sp. NPDC047042]|uniref:hypothetical protein n=1 Tax=Streptomyces sp. NPDC047042 TaxID=3154807 RepID=UPI003408B23F
MAFPEDALGVTPELGIDGVFTSVKPHTLTRDIVTHTRGQGSERDSANPASCSLTLKSPNGLYSPRNPRSEYFEKIGLNTPMRVSVIAGQQRLLIPETAPTARVTTPSATALNIAGNLDARIEVTLLHWWLGSEIELFGKYLTTGNQRSWQLSLGVAGGLSLRASTDGNAVASYVSTVAVPVPSSGRLALRVTRDNATGIATFYTAPSISGTWTQLGSTVTMPTGAIYASTAPLTIGDIDTLAFAAPYGSVHAAQLRNGIGGTLVADVDFTVPAIGASSFVDAVGLTWTLANGAEITNRQTRFVGEFSDWPADWSGRAELITVEGEGVGILERMSQGRKQLASTLRRRIPAYAPVAYWPMEEGDEATTISSPVAGVRSFKPVALDMGADDTLAGSSPLPMVQVGASFVAPVPASAPAGTWQVELVYRLSALPVATTTLFEVRTTGTARRVRVRVSASAVTIDGLDADDSSLFTQSVTPTEFTGPWARLQIRAVQSGGNVTYSVRWLIIGGAGWTTSGTIAAVPGRVVDVRSSFGTGLDGMAFGHLAVFSTPTDIPFNSADQAFAGETAGDRMVRLCQEEGVPFRLAGAPSGTVRLGPQRPGTLLGLLQECADTDGGIFGEDRERLGLRYRPRLTLYNQSPVVTLPYGSKGVTLGRPVEPDSSTVRNDVTVQLPTGGFGRAVLESGRLSVQDPPAGVGLYEETYDLNLRTDDMADPHAYWRMALRTWDEARYPTITIKLHRATQLISTILALAEGDMIRITDLPDFLPPGPVDLLVLGYQERLGTHTWEIELVCVPAGPYRVGVVGSTDSRIDANSGGSLVATAVGATDTTLAVHTRATRPMAPTPWITSSGPAPNYSSDFPIPVVVAGEELSATAIRPWGYDTFGRSVAAGAWGTATDGQTWTLTGGSNSDRSVNGSRGVVTLAAAVSTVRFQTLPGVVGDCEVRCRMSASAVATGNPLLAAVLLRYVDASNYYRARVHFGLSGAMYVSVSRDTTQIGTEVLLPYTYIAASEYEVRVRLTGHLVQIRVWPVGSPEPAVWHTEQTVVSSPISSGLVGLSASAFTGNTNVSPSLLFDEFVVPTPQAWTVARAVNGVSKPQLAGTEVRVTRPAVVAL